MKRRDWLTGVERLLFPRDVCCAWCGAERGLHPCGLCEDCLDHLPWNDTPALQAEVVCHAPLRYEGDAKRMIHALKFQGRRYLADPLGRLMAECLRDAKADGCIPVPLHAARYQERGFNQSELLCRAISQELNIPVWETGLRRVRDTRHQIGLSAEERKENVRDAFEADGLCDGENPDFDRRRVYHGRDVCRLRPCAARQRGGGAWRSGGPGVRIAGR